LKKNQTLHFSFGTFKSSVHIRREIPRVNEIAAGFGTGFFRPLLICDEHSVSIADSICGAAGVPRCVLQSGESQKRWPAVEAILHAAHKAGLGRDGVFIGVGGGVIGDLTAFAASVYMRGCALVLVSTTLLGMVDASLGGKTGFDLFGVKNLAGTFYPARHVYMPLESLATLPPGEWKSGMAELIKTAVLENGPDAAGGLTNAVSGKTEDGFMDELAAIAAAFPPGSFDSGFPSGFASRLLDCGADQLAHCIGRAVSLKGSIVEADPIETGGRRFLLNLGHTFGHALESAAGLGALSHGEAVAWGIVRSCELGLALGITPPARAEKIKTLIAAYGYETGSPHPLMARTETFIKALDGDKKKRGGNNTFIVPGETSACAVELLSVLDKNKIKETINGDLSF
jgi:3-dehydroquinate synthase